MTSSSSTNRRFPLGGHAAAAWDDIGVPALANFDQNSGNNFGRAFVCEARLNGKRQWAASSYSLAGVEIRLNTLVGKIVFENSSDIIRATGVELEDGTIIPAGEVISCAGAIRTPQLLHLSGIGPSEDLKSIGIEPLADLPEVGRELIDHMSFFQHWRLRDPSACYTLGTPNPLFSQPQYSHGVPMDWIITNGVSHEGLAEAIEKDEGTEPDATSHTLLSKTRSFLETAVLYAKIPFPGIPVDTEHVTTSVTNLLPTSRGRVTLTSTSPADPPKSKFDDFHKLNSLELTLQNSRLELPRYRGRQVRIPRGTSSTLWVYVRTTFRKVHQRRDSTRRPSNEATFAR